MVTPCCGRSLRTGTIIVASMEIIFSTISAIFYVLGLAAVGSSSFSSVLDGHEIRAIQHNFRIPFVDLQEDRHGSSSEYIVGALTAIFIVALLSSVTAIAFSTFLLLSLRHRKGNGNQLKIWLVYKIILLILAVVFIFTVAVSGYSTLVSSISDILSTVMHAYFFWVVYAHWNEMRDDDDAVVVAVEKTMTDIAATTTIAASTFAPASSSITQIQPTVPVDFPL